MTKGDGSKAKDYCVSLRHVLNLPPLPKNPLEQLRDNLPPVPQTPPELGANLPPVPRTPTQQLGDNLPPVPLTPPELGANLPPVPRTPTQQLGDNLPPVPLSPPENHQLRLAGISATVNQVVTGFPNSSQERFTNLFATKTEPFQQLNTVENIEKNASEVEDVERQLAVLQTMEPQLLSAAEDQLARAKNLLEQLPESEGDLRNAATNAWNYLNDALNDTALAAGKHNQLSKLNVGKENAWATGPEKPNKRLNCKEQTRALNKATAAIELAVSNPNSVEAKLLKLEGGKKFADGMFGTYATLVAFGANHNGISPAEALAIHRYTGQDYDNLNILNRSGPEALQVSAKELKRLEFLNETCANALKKMPKYPEFAWPVYRAERAWSQEMVYGRYGKGKKFTCGTLWSTGARGEVDISANAKSPHFSHVIYGKSGRDIAAMSANAGEGAEEKEGFKASLWSGRGEVLFASQTEFQVTDRKDPPGGKVQFEARARGDIVKVVTTLKEISNG